MNKHRFVKRIVATLMAVAIFFVNAPSFVAPAKNVNAASNSIEVTNFDELTAALKNTSISTIIIANNINVDVSKSNAKSNSALLTADRNVTIVGKDGVQYTIKRTGSTSTVAKSLLEVYGNGTYDGVNVTIIDVILDGGAVWKSGSTPKTRIEGKNGSGTTKSSQNSGIAGRAVVDVANKGTLNLENGTVVRNGESITNAQTRNGTANSSSGSSQYGGGIRVEYASGGTVNVKAGSAIENCTAINWGGGIGAYNYARLNLYGGTISNCSSGYGGAISVTYRGGTDSSTAGVIKVYGGEVKDCYSPNKGGAFYFDGKKDFYLLGGTFTNCTAATSSGGGILGCDSDATVYLANVSYFTISNVTGGNYSGQGWTTTGSTTRGIYKATATIKAPPVQTVVFNMDGKQYAKLQVVQGTSLGEAFPADPVKANSYFNGWYSSSTKYTKTTQIYNNLTLTGRMHTHNYVYSANGNVITTDCTGEWDCPYKASMPKLTVTTAVTSKEYDRRPFNSVKVTNEITPITGVVASDIVYYEKGNATPLSGAPKDVGEYEATVAIKDAVAKVSFSIGKVPASNFETDKLNNKVNSENQFVKSATNDATSNIKVILNSSEDTIALYKIGTMEWNEKNPDYNDIEWVGEVKEWILNNSATYDLNNYGNITALKDVATDRQMAFYNALLAEDSTLFKSKETGGLGLEPIKTTTSEENQTYEPKEGEDGTSYYYYTFDNLHFGTYAIIATNAGGTKYSPLVVNVAPERRGPHTDWYVLDTYVVTLKEVAAGINKFINDQDLADIISYNAEVSFTVNMELPSINKDRVTVSKTDTSIKDYALYMTDEMSPSYTMKGTPTMKYSYKNGESQDFTLTPIPYYEFYDYAPVVGGNITEVKQIVSSSATPASNEIKLSDVSYDSEPNTNLVGKYAVQKSAPIYTISAIKVAEDTGVTTFRVDFNVHALKAYLKQSSTLAGDYKFILNYTATVTDKVQVGTDTNTNIASIHYEKSNGEMAADKDTVYGYTYGLNVVKIDGDTAETDDVKYVAGAKFKLYKFDAEYPLGIDAEPESPADPEDSDGGEEPGEAAEPIDPELISELKAIRKDIKDKGSGSDYYIYEDDAIYVYKVYENALIDNEVYGLLNASTPTYDKGGFTSVNHEKGITLVGLTEGSYILTEVKAPIGYNVLAEDIYFEINKLDEKIAITQYQGSLKSFVEMDDTLNESGIISLDVLNYKGLTLPSTGGIGVLIFIIIGLGLMGSTMVILILRRKKAEEFL